MKEGVLITGSNGFVGKNLLIKIIENGKYDPVKFNRGDSLDFIEQNINQIKLIVHLAAENRSDVQEDFKIKFGKDVFADLQPHNVVTSRTSEGGTGFIQVEKEVNNWQKKLLL